MNHLTNLKELFTTLLNPYIRDKTISNDYEDVTLVLNSAFRDWQDDCRKEAIAYLKDVYGEDREDINYDIVEIYSDSVGTKSKGITNKALRYGNLYSFVLACGLDVSYADWTYEETYVGFDPEKGKTLICIWDAETQIGITRKQLGKTWKRR